MGHEKRGRGFLMGYSLMLSSTLWFLLLTFTGVTIEGGPNMEISSAAFRDGGKIPVQYVMAGAGGHNTSLPVSWKNPPPGTKSFALSIVDPHPVARNWVHWLVINIPGMIPAHG